MTDFTLVVQLVTIAGQAAIIGLVIILWNELRLIKYQTEHRFRAWIGPSSGIEFIRATPEGQQQFVITIKNYGALPASNVVVLFTMTNEMPTRDTSMYKLRSSDSTDKFILGPLMPNMEKSYWFFIGSDAIQKAKDGKTRIFVALYFAYEFPKGRGGYGMISQFDTNTNTFVHKDMWMD